MNEYTKQLKAKGWTPRAISKRWGKSMSTITRLCRNPSQRDLDALNGLQKRPPAVRNPDGRSEGVG